MAENILLPNGDSASAKDLTGNIKLSRALLVYSTGTNTYQEIDATHPLFSQLTDASGNVIASSTSAPAGTERGLIVRQASVVTAGGITIRATSNSMTRPADTTAYAAGDGVTTATSSAAGMTVPNVARISGGSGVILGGRASKSTTGTTNAQFRLWIYQNSASVTIPNDNAAFSPAVVADRAKLVGWATVDFSAGVAGSDGVTAPIVFSESAPMGFKCTGTDFLVIWEARAAYTPGSAEVFYLELAIGQD